jgi:DNA-binding response OmpR family regulator
MENSTILVIEDNGRLRKFVASSLIKAGYRVLQADSGKSAFDILKTEYLDLVLLDLRLGDMDGLEILRTIRRQDETLPIIIVSSIDDQDIKVGGFDLGCDDYITKPFYVEELLGRVKRLLKRRNFRDSLGIPATVLERIISGPFELDIKTLRVFKNGQALDMRKKLFDLFLFFVRHPDTILSNEALFNRAWDSREDMNENSLYVHIRQLRKLVEDEPAKPRYIQTIRNAGYIFSLKGKDSLD